MPQSHPLDRRSFLRISGGVAALAAAGQVVPHPAAAAPRISNIDPFTLGIASGDPRPTSVVLWTRLAPEPLTPDGGVPPVAVPVRWWLARDEAMRHVVATGKASALPELAHSVHVEVNGLCPGREYFYRFAYRDARTVVGRTRTAPTPGTSVGALHFAFASCQRWDDGYYSAYRHMAEDDLDLVVHLGDYIYEDGIRRNGGLRDAQVPGHLRSETRSLDRYRMQYGLYKSDRQLQRAHAQFPWAVTWDDHEVDNDYSGGEPENGKRNGRFLHRRAAGYQAFYEHQPLRAASIPDGGSLRLYRRFHWGDLAQFDVLDGRQYRDDSPCGEGEQQPCPELYDPAVSMLGHRQERWLVDGLAASTARWNVVANPVLVAQLDHVKGDGQRFWTDSWDGYPAARERLLQALRPTRNPVVITGDWHSTFVNELKADFRDPDSATLAVEFVGTSISTNGDAEVYGPYYGPFIPFNEHIKFFDGDRRGYVRCTLDRDTWRSDLRMVTTVSRPDAPAYTLASFEVQDGVRGVTRVAGDEPLGGVAAGWGPPASSASSKGEEASTLLLLGGLTAAAGGASLMAGRREPEQDSRGEAR